MGFQQPVLGVDRGMKVAANSILVRLVEAGPPREGPRIPAPQAFWDDRVHCQAKRAMHEHM